MFSYIHIYMYIKINFGFLDILKDFDGDPIYFYFFQIYSTNKAI